MTNNEIISTAWMILVSTGKIDKTEDIHTYAGWKERGYQVRRGEKAVDKFSIWKYATSKKKTETGETTEEPKMFLKESAWFSTKQVDLIQA